MSPNLTKLPPFLSIILLHQANYLYIMQLSNSLNCKYMYLITFCLVPFKISTNVPATPAWMVECALMKSTCSRVLVPQATWEPRVRQVSHEIQTQIRYLECSKLFFFFHSQILFKTVQVELIIQTIGVNPRGRGYTTTSPFSGSGMACVNTRC